MISKKEIDRERVRVQTRGVETVERIEKMLPQLKDCIRDGIFPLWIADLVHHVQELFVLAGKDSQLKALSALTKKRA